MRRTLVRMDLLDDEGIYFKYVHKHVLSAAYWTGVAAQQYSLIPWILVQHDLILRGDVIPAGLVYHQGVHAAKYTCGFLHAALREELARPPEPFRPLSESELGWRKYLPIRKMTAEEYERHLERKAKREEHRCFPVLPSGDIE